MNIRDIAILNIHGADYRCIIGGISTIDDKLNAKYWLDWKKRNIMNHKNFLQQIKIDEEILTFGDDEIKKNSAVKVQQ